MRLTTLFTLMVMLSSCNAQQEYESCQFQGLLGKNVRAVFEFEGLDIASLDTANMRYSLLPTRHFKMYEDFQDFDILATLYLRAYFDRDSVITKIRYGQMNAKMIGITDRIRFIKMINEEPCVPDIVVSDFKKGEILSKTEVKNGIKTTIRIKESSKLMDMIRVTWELE